MKELNSFSTSTAIQYGCRHANMFQNLSDFPETFLFFLFSICLFILFWFTAGKNISLTKIFSIKLTDLPDIQKNIKRNYEGLGINARKDSASLGKNVTLFRLHRPGFQHVDRSVALESNLHPGLYLRYKNYKFRMEKAKPTGLFGKVLTWFPNLTQA